MVFANYPKKEHYIFGSNLEYHEEIEKYLAFFYFDEEKVEICWFLGFCCLWFLLWFFPVEFVSLFYFGWLAGFVLFVYGWFCFVLPQFGV